MSSPATNRNPHGCGTHSSLDTNGGTNTGVISQTGRTPMRNTIKRLEARGGSGFTLIELLVVIAILAILSGVVVFAVGNSTKNADKVACETERASLITAHKAAVTSNKVNTTNKSWTNYLENPTLKYFDAPVAVYTGTPTFTAARNSEGGTIADCTSLSI